jgi:hypothetical protein
MILNSLSEKVPVIHGESPASRRGYDRRLEDELACKLEDTTPNGRRGCGRNCAKRSLVAYVRRREREIRRVGNVVYLSSELEFQTLAYREVAEQRKINASLVETKELVSSLVAGISPGLLSKGRCIERLGD